MASATPTIGTKTLEFKQKIQRRGGAFEDVAIIAVLLLLQAMMIARPEHRPDNYAIIKMPKLWCNIYSIISNDRHKP